MGDALEFTLRLALGGPDHAPVTLERRPVGANQSILTELCARYTGAPVGLHHFSGVREHPDGTHEPLDLFVKVKPADSVLIAAGSELAEQITPGFGALYARYSPLRELGRSHVREAAVYQLDMPALQPFLPALYASSIDPDTGLSILALEHLSEVELLADMTATDRWTLDHWHAAIDAVSILHAHWLERDTELLSMPWIARNAAGPQVIEMMAWWEALGDFVARYFTDWLGADAPVRYDILRESMPQWWSASSRMPRTLIHNDFNPRNLAFRRVAGRPRVCIFDWELATLGVPQHDLAELLCFALPERADREWFEHIVEHHRTRLEAVSGMAFARSEWRLGLVLSLNHLYIDRLPMYTLIHALKPLPYLQRVARNWQRLDAWVHQAE